MGDVAGFLISGWDWFTDKLLAQLVALLVGAVVVQRFYVRQSHKAALIDYLVARLEDVKRESMTYWSKPQDEDGPIAAQRVKGALKGLFADVGYFCERYSEAPLHVPLQRLFDACTDGGFESRDCGPDLSRHMRIVNSTNELRIRLLKCKL